MSISFFTGKRICKAEELEKLKKNTKTKIFVIPVKDIMFFLKLIFNSYKNNIIETKKT